MSLTKENCIRAMVLFESCSTTAPSVDTVARHCGLSRSHFSAAFKASVGLTPAQWRLGRKVDKARLLLKCGLPIAEVAVCCGFADQAHLTRAFRALVGMSPGKWRSVHLGQ